MEPELNLILEVAVAILGLLSIIFGKKWLSASKLIKKKIHLLREVFKEGEDLFAKLDEIEDFSKLKKKELIELMKEVSEFLNAIREAYEDP